MCTSEFFTYLKVSSFYPWLDLFSSLIQEFHLTFLLTEDDRKKTAPLVTTLTNGSEITVSARHRMGESEKGEISFREGPVWSHSLSQVS